MSRPKNRRIKFLSLLLLFLPLISGYTYLQSKTVDIWFTYWDVSNSLNNLKNIHKDKINGINLFFYSLDKDGNIINALLEPDEYKQILSTIQKLEVKIVPTLTNDIIYSKTNTILKDPDIISKILNDSTLRKKHIQQIMEIAKGINADGIDIDYEQMYAKDRDKFSQFIKELSGVLHDQNMTLSVTVQQKTEDHQRQGAGAIDWQEISNYADQIIIMCYNYSSKTSKPGSICPLFWLKDIIKFAKSQVPSEKICIALGLYGYDWSNKDCNSVNFKKVVELVKENSAVLFWDRESQSPYFSYSKSGLQHEVWFENQESILKKIKLIKRHNINHTAIWHLGLVESSLFEPFESFLE